MNDSRKWKASGPFLHGTSGAKSLPPDSRSVQPKRNTRLGTRFRAAFVSLGVVLFGLLHDQQTGGAVLGRFKFRWRFFSGLGVAHLQFVAIPRDDARSRCPGSERTFRDSPFHRRGLLLGVQFVFH